MRLATWEVFQTIKAGMNKTTMYCAGRVPTPESYSTKLRCSVALVACRTKAPQRASVVYDTGPDEGSQQTTLFRRIQEEGATKAK